MNARLMRVAGASFERAVIRVAAFWAMTLQRLGQHEDALRPTSRLPMASTDSDANG